MLEVIVFEGVQNLPLFAAQAQGFFARRGVEVNVQFTPNSWTLRDGLASGKYHIAHTAVDNAIAMAELAHADIAVVMGGDPGFNSVFFQPGIKSFEDLRGKTVLVDAPNTAFALVLYKILSLHGVERGQYEAKSVGATPLRMKAMLEDKNASAAIMNLPFRILGQEGGLKEVGEATDFIGPYLSTAGFVMRPWARENSDVLVRYIQAYVDGLRWALMSENAVQATQLLVDNLKLEPHIAKRAYDIATASGTGFAIDAEMDFDGLRNVLKLRAEVEGQWDGVPPEPERYVDLSWHAAALGAM